MLFPFYDVTMLAFESNCVINLRLAKIGRGGPQAFDEIQLMIAEKAEAIVEAGVGLMLGDTAAGTIGRFRSHVAENQARLAA